MYVHFLYIFCIVTIQFYNTDSTQRLHSDFYPMPLISSMNKYIEYLSYVVKKNKVKHNSSYSERSKLYR